MSRSSGGIAAISTWAVLLAYAVDRAEAVRDRIQRDHRARVKERSKRALARTISFTLREVRVMHALLERAALEEGEDIMGLIIRNANLYPAVCSDGKGGSNGLPASIQTKLEMGGPHDHD